MKNFFGSRYLTLLLAWFTVFSLTGQPKLQIANLGNVVLESGQVIENCQLGYRTYGVLNQDRSNVVLFPGWLGGTSEQASDLVGKDKYIDDSRWFVITIDPIGNGISSSPSNYSNHAESDFPDYTIRDMVMIEHTFLTRSLGIQSLYGVVGMSMGGHEVFEWIVAYPSFVKKAVSIVGTPKMTGYELLYWQTELEILNAFQNCPSCNKGRFLNLWLSLFGYSSIYQNSKIHPENFNQFLDQVGETKFSVQDYCSQIRAIMKHDVSRKNGSTMEKAASLVKSDLMVIVAITDLICNPEPAVEFAKLVGGEIHKLESPCGHLSGLCELKIISEFVSKFFNEQATN